jgi:poly(A) polymerase
VGAGQPLTVSADPAFPYLRRASEEIGARAYAVGGFVRDRLLGRAHPDLDVVAEDGRGLDLARRFADLARLPPPVVFERFGTAQVRDGDRVVEFVSARAESYDPDSRKPSVRAATLDEDLRRRDFTVNALLMDFDGGIHDRLGTGLRDLESRVLRTPIEPAQTFADDPLRMLRAVRFAAQLGFALDATLPGAMRGLRERLRPPVISVERIADELRLMLVSDRPGLAMRLLNECGLLEVVLPEVAAGRGVEQGGWHIADVLGHTMLALDASERELLVRLAVLFHDVGKPVTATPDGAFVGHERVGAEMARDALRRLRFSNSEVERVAALVRLHLRPVFYDSGWTDGAVRRLAAAAGPDLPLLMAVARADIAASAYPEPEKLDELGRRLDAVSREPERVRPVIRGEDVMAELGLPPGPEVGRVKRHLEGLVLDGDLDAAAEAVRGYLREHRADLLATARNDD